MRGMLCEAVERQPGCTVCGAAESAEQALAELPGAGIDLVLVDVSLPQMSGVELVRALREQLPDLVCLMVSGHVEASYAEQAIAAGASGYVLKGRPRDLGAAITTVLAGGRYLSKPLEGRLVGEP